MKTQIVIWWKTTNEGYSKLIGEKATNGEIIKVALGILGFILLTGFAQILEDAI